MPASASLQEDEEAAEEDAADEEEEEDDEDMEGGDEGMRRYPLRDRAKAQVQPYVPGTGGGMLRRAGCAAALSCHSHTVPLADSTTCLVCVRQDSLAAWQFPVAGPRNVGGCIV